MRTLRVLMVDDETLARVRLRNLLADCIAPSAVVLAEAANARQAVEALAVHDFDLALLDIHMPGDDGLTLARTIAALPYPPAVVFVTAYAEHALAAFELNAVDYLTKPVRIERLQQALQKVERNAQSNRALQPDSSTAISDADAMLIITERSRTVRVPVAEVIYLKAELKYLTVRTRAHSHILDASLSDLEARFPGRFLRIHRNALILRSAVRALEKHVDDSEGEGWAVRLAGVDELLMVSRRQLGLVRELIGKVI